MKYTEIDGIVITPEFAEENRQYIVELRDAALRQGEMTWALNLSMTIAIMYDYIKKITPAKVDIASNGDHDGI